MPRFIDLTKQKFNRLTVLERAENSKTGLIRWKCRCKCGNTTIVASGHLRAGNIKSCGCIKKELLSERNFVHGMSRVLEYNSWNQMKNRCNNPKGIAYKNYGDRGITICESWENDFMAFYNDVGPRPSKKHSIERKDNDGNYCPENCYWATRKEQANNKRNNNKIIINGWDLTLAQWSEFTGVNPQTMRSRIYSGWPVEKSIFKRVNH